MIRHSTRAFTLIDLCAAAIAAPTLLAIAAVAVGRAQPANPDSPDALPDPAARAAEMRSKDQGHLRAIIQGHVLWAQSNQDRYPLPSLIDTDNFTVRGPAADKDTTANIQSLLVYNSFFPAALLVSPAEVNESIVADADYQLDDPKAAVQPEKAFWDPALAADFTVGQANISYANLQPSGGRAARWSVTYQAAEPVIANRGPQIDSVARQPDGSVKFAFANPQSKTLRIHGDGARWTGNIAYADASVRVDDGLLNPAAPLAPGGPRHYLGAEAKEWPDVWCYDEPDDKDSKNDYLGIFITAGTRPELFKAIWD